jgi:hypothetical protein
MGSPAGAGLTGPITLQLVKRALWNRQIISALHPYILITAPLPKGGGALFCLEPLGAIRIDSPRTAFPSNTAVLAVGRELLPWLAASEAMALRPITRRRASYRA